MVLETEAQSQQFVHCKFRENVVRALYLPPTTPHSSHSILIVNKFGGVGVYDPDRFKLLQAYLLDLSVWHHPDTTTRESSVVAEQPKCQRSHLVVDAAFAPHLTSVFYLTNKGILQGFDVGEMEMERYGVDLLPGRSFGHLKSGKSPVEVKNGGHVETHQIYGLPPFPTCLEYCPGDGSGEIAAGDVARPPGQGSRMLLIGSSDGSVTLLRIPDDKHLFGGRKIRGMVHKIKLEELERMGLVRVDRGHTEPVTDLLFIPEHQLVATTSKDRNFSVTLKDLQGVMDPSIISLPKGANAVAHSEMLKIFATGSDDALVRLFNQFVPKRAQAELRGHRSPVIALAFIQVPFSPRPLLFSFSTALELRAWDPATFDPLQSLYISFPIRSTIICKTPEFPRRAILDFQQLEFQEGSSNTKLGTKVQRSLPGNPAGGSLVVLYCNSWAKVRLEREDSYWPFDFGELAAEFESVAASVQRRVRGPVQSLDNSGERYHVLSPAEVAEVEGKLESYVNEIMSLQERVATARSSAQEESRRSSLSAQLARSCNTLRQDKAKKQCLRDGGAFKLLSTVDIEDPIQFPLGQLPPVTDLMRDAGLTQVTCPADLQSPAALMCFSSDNMAEMKMDAAVAKLNYSQVLERHGGNESSRSSLSSAGHSGRADVINGDPGSDGRSDDIDTPLEISGDETDSDIGDGDDDDEYVQRSLQKLLEDVTPEPPSDP